MRVSEPVKRYVDTDVCIVVCRCCYVEDSDKYSMHGITSVSYTHLRAHETREDLVCRLLLEKKK